MLKPSKYYTELLCFTRGDYCKCWCDLRVEHDLCHQHILEWGKRTRAVNRIVTFKRLVKVRVRRLEVLLFGCVKDAYNKTQAFPCIVTSKCVKVILTWLQVKSSLKLGWTVNAISGCSCRSESGFRSRQVTQCMVHFTFEQLHFHKQRFVVQLLQLLQKRRS